MRRSTKLSIALVTVGVLTLSACGKSTAKLLESPKSNTKNAALDDTSGLNIKSMTFDRTKLNNWQKYPNGIGVEDQIVRDETKYPLCPKGLTTVANIDTPALNSIMTNCQREFIILHYTGFITAPGNAGETVSVKFRMAKDDTYVMKIGETTVIDDWHNTGCANREGTINMVAGKKYPFDAWFSQYGGGICSQLSWSVAGGTQVVVPSSAFSRVDDTPAATTTTVEATTTTVEGTTTTIAEQTATQEKVTTTTVVEAAASENAVTTTAAPAGESTGTTPSTKSTTVTADTTAANATEDSVMATDTTVATDMETTETAPVAGDSDSSSNNTMLFVLLGLGAVIIFWLIVARRRRDDDEQAK